MSNVLSEEKKQQVIALGRLGWSLRRIERAAHIRRETVGEPYRELLKPNWQKVATRWPMGKTLWTDVGHCLVALARLSIFSWSGVCRSM